MNARQIFLSLVTLLLVSCAKTSKEIPEENFNLNWNFYLSDRDIEFAEIQENQYKQVNLPPHDWVIEGEFDESLGQDAWATGYIRGGEGYGYYTKTFDKPITEDEVVYILFDGVYNNSTIYINGHKLGFHPYGYSPFYFEFQNT